MGELTKFPSFRSNSNTDTLIIAFDADEDIRDYDPRAPNESYSIGQLLDSYEHIEGHKGSYHIAKKSSHTDNKDDNYLDKDVRVVIQSPQGMKRYDSEFDLIEIQSSPKLGSRSQRRGSDFHILEEDEIESCSIQDRANNEYSTVLSAGDSVCGARQNLIKLHLAKRENDFTDLHPFKIFIGTWNVNGKLPSECLKPWLQQLQGEDGPPDIFAIGFQELDLSVEALLRSDVNRENKWIESIEAALPLSGSYFKVQQVRLVGIFLVVYVLEKHKRYNVRSVSAETYGTGMMGLMGNKGGVAIRFQLHHSTICFVNSHLAAFHAQFERRNQDFNQIYRNLKFSSFLPPLNISNHDMVFWLGDLNYRIDLDIDEVKRFSRTGDYKGLYVHDQLNKQRSEGKAFGDFTETPPNFTPTYKFDPGTDDWDSSEKMRIPAWCDRVLWKGKHIDQLHYDCQSAIKSSDHKPVSSLFNVSVKVVDPAREKKVVQEIEEKLDREGNPQVMIANQELSFGTVSFMKRDVIYLPVVNTGQRIIEFQFVPRLDQEEVCICKPWFSINPVVGYIMPGDRMDIELAVYVDKRSAPLVTKSNYCLNDNLVLHLLHGNDVFISVSAEYKPSVFGSSLDALVRIRSAISDTPIESLLQLEGGASLENSNPTDLDQLEIPKELLSLTNHIKKFGMTKEQILMRDIGTDKDVIQIRTYLDTGQQEGEIPGSIYSVGNALLLFLESLCEPVIPFSFHSRCHEVCDNIDSCKQMVNSLPTIHFNTFKHVCTFLRELLEQSAENTLDANMLAAMFGPILLRSPHDQNKNLSRVDQFQTAQKKSRFVLHFFTDDFDF